MEMLSSGIYSWGRRSGGVCGSLAVMVSFGERVDTKRPVCVGRLCFIIPFVCPS